MKISTKGRYALRMMIDLAKRQKIDSEKYTALKDIAQRIDISKKYLERIIPLLNRADILLTNRGFQGGYKLARSADAYTVAEILSITEGGLAPIACLERQPFGCEKADECPTLKMWQGLYDVILNYLEGVTIAQLAEQGSEFIENYRI